MRFRVDAFPTDEFIGQRDAGSPAADDGAERRDLSDRHRRAESRLEAQARNDGQREHRDCAAQPTCCACRTPRCGSGRRPRSSPRSDRLPRRRGRARGRGAGAGRASPDTRSDAAGSCSGRRQQPPRSRPRSQRRRSRRAAGTLRPGSRSAAAAEPAAQGEASAPQMGRGDGAGGGRRGGRGNFAERMASMTPEERERFMERMRARGFTPPAEGTTAAAPQGGSSGQGPRRQGQAQPAQPAAPSAAQGAHDVRRPVRPADTTENVRPGLAASGRQAAARPAAPWDHRRPADRTDSGARRRRQGRHRGRHERHDRRRAGRPRLPPAATRSRASVAAARAGSGGGGGGRGGGRGQ